MRREGLKASYAAPALEKAFEILELLADRPNGATVSELATDLDRTVGELFRIVIVMEQHGYLQKSRVTDRYTLAYKMLDIAIRATPAHDLVEVALPVMTALTQEIGQSCHLVVVNDIHGLVIARRENPGIRGFALRVGAQIDLLNSCSGNVILAFLSTEEYDRIIAAATRKRKIDVEKFEDHLRSVRDLGHDLRRSPITFGVTDVSFPLFGFDNTLAGALTIPFLALVDGSQKVGLEAATRRLSESARQISNMLGWRDPEAGTGASGAA